MKLFIIIFIYYVIISLSNLTFCEEIEIARGQQIYQSCLKSSPEDARCNPEAAVDGNPSTYTVAFYNPDDDSPDERNVKGAWITINFEEAYCISRISVSFLQSRSRYTLDIYLLYEIKMDRYTVTNYNTLLLDSKYENFLVLNQSVPESIGTEILHVSIKSTNLDPLSVKEIQIFTFKGFKISKISNSLQSSTVPGWEANYALDNKMNTCSLTNMAISWWSVDLGLSYYITGIKINNTDVKLLNQPKYIFTYVSMQLKEIGYLCNIFNNSEVTLIKKIYCQNIIYGRFVKILNNENMSSLGLCDVAIYGFRVNQISTARLETTSSITSESLQTTSSTLITITSLLNNSTLNESNNSEKYASINMQNQLSNAYIIIGVLSAIILILIIIFIIIGLIISRRKKHNSRNQIPKNDNAIFRNDENPSISVNNNNTNSILNSFDNHQNIELEDPDSYLKINK